LKLLLRMIGSYAVDASDHVIASPTV
jgi:hypothetical protein